MLLDFTMIKLKKKQERERIEEREWKKRESMEEREWKKRENGNRE